MTCGRGTANAYWIHEACYYENDPILFGHGISKRISKSGSSDRFGRVCRVGGLCYKQRNQHSVEPVPDGSRFSATLFAKR